jgi:hypothetical protein
MAAASSAGCHYLPFRLAIPFFGGTAVVQWRHDDMTRNMTRNQPIVELLTIFR